MTTPARGFTLLEVLVAMAVLALALLSISRATGNYIANQAYMRDRTYAQWVARNHLAEIQVSAQWPSVGQTKGEVEFPQGEREWRWVMQVIQTEEEALRRLDIEVYPLNAEQDEEPLATLSGFMGRH